MKKLILIYSIIVMGCTSIQAQKYFTRAGHISFLSDAPIEKIEAVNNNATSVMDIESGRIEFAVLIKAFQFEKALMQEHFNENYMESSKFPKSIFKGQITNVEAIDLFKNGTYEAHIKGNLTVHGVTKPLDTKGQFIVKEKQLIGKATFIILVEDFDIKIPAVVKDNVAKEVEISITCDYQALGTENK